MESNQNDGFNQHQKNITTSNSEQPLKETKNYTIVMEFLEKTIEAKFSYN